MHRQRTWSVAERIQLSLVSGHLACGYRGNREDLCEKRSGKILENNIEERSGCRVI